MTKPPCMGQGLGHNGPWTLALWHHMEEGPRPIGSWVLYGAGPWAQWTLDPSLVAPYGGGPKACWVLGPGLELQCLTLSSLDR